MIAEYEAEGRSPLLDSPRQYALAQMHKHLPEMQAVCGLDYAPAFSPIVSDYYCGMCVTVPLFSRLLRKKMTVNALKSYFAEYYASHNFVKVTDADAYMAANALAGSNEMHISVAGNDERPLLLALFDNLGKGASGAAVQCMNIALGLDERTSLI